MNTKFHKSICRVCEGFLSQIKCIRGENTRDDVALFKCNNCISYFSKMELSQQMLNNFNGGSIDVYMNKDFVLNRVQDILSYSLEKNWLTNKDVNFLDIGCGVGWSLVIAKKKKFKAYGVEPMKVAADYGNKILKVKVINSLFRSDIFKDKKFDFIMMDQVLEHVPNPLETIVDAFHLLKSGGLFFLGVPPLDWSRILLSMSYQFPMKILDYLENTRYLSKLILLARKHDTFRFPEGHINYFSTNAVEIIAERCNAQLVEQYHINRKRPKYFPLFKLSTGSFFLRKK